MSLPAVEERALLTEEEAAQAAGRFEERPPQELLEWAFDRFGTDRFAIITSFQADGVVVVDMAHRIRPDLRVITIDTGRMPQEFYDVITSFRRRYGLEIEILSPDTAAVEAMVRRHGPNLFYESVPNRLLCCQVRKVMPLNRVLRDLDCWSTGLRRDQSGSRSGVQKISIDHDHGGIVKLAPLADWNEDRVIDYIREHEVPVHPLYSQGYTSISCAPCTRAVEPGAHPRSGRWWWEQNAPKECGMHCSLETGAFPQPLAAEIGAASSRKQG